ncbi:MAG: 4Fe-4S binding protein, partial [Planctomycetota bacterium]|nr:4Fe-4S binding protein [Planctomycetota bacterium]
MFLVSRETGVPGRHSVQPQAGKCTGCLDCVRACPTRAVRVYGGSPTIIGELCVDCGACAGACARGALDVTGGEEELPTPAHGEVLVATAALAAQFGRPADASEVVFHLKACGFADVYFLEEWEFALRSAAKEYSKAENRGAAAISPVCPAVLNLIACRFPSLLRRVAPFLSPIEAAASELAGRKAMFAFLCPCQRTALAAMLPAAGLAEAVSIRSVIRRLMPRMASSRFRRGAPVGGVRRKEPPGPASSPEAACAAGILRVTGMRHAMAFL